MANDIVRTINTDEVQLNNLFKEVLDGLRDDVEEAKENVERYLSRITTDPQTLDLYGPLLNTALSIKGSARDKQLKFLNTFKDRVTKKEAIELSKGESKSGGMSVDITAINAEIEAMKKNGIVSMDFDDQDEDENI